MDAGDTDEGKAGRQATLSGFTTYEQGDDAIVTAKMTQLLWDAAPQPKEQRWYDSGHLLPAEAYAAAARWLQKRTED